MFDFLINKNKPETQAYKKQNKVTTKSELHEKFDKTCDKILEKWPILNHWTDFRRTCFDNILFNKVDIISDPTEYEKYINETWELADYMNCQISKNIENWKEFCSDKSPRFVVVRPMQGVGDFTYVYPELYYATDFEIAEDDSGYYPEMLTFYGRRGTDKGFNKIFIFPTYHTIRNMDRDEFVKFLNQELSSTHLLPWEFDEFKQKWTNLYEQTNGVGVIETDAKECFEKTNKQ